MCLFQGPVLFPHVSFSAAASPRARSCPGCHCYHLSPPDMPDFKAAHLVMTSVPFSKENAVGYWVTQVLLPSEVTEVPLPSGAVQWQSLSVVRAGIFHEQMCHNNLSSSGLLGPPGENKGVLPVQFPDVNERLLPVLFPLLVFCVRAGWAGHLAWRGGWARGTEMVESKSS